MKEKIQEFFTYLQTQNSALVEEKKFDPNLLYTFCKDILKLDPYIKYKYKDVEIKPKKDIKLLGLFKIGEKPAVTDSRKSDEIDCIIMSELPYPGHVRFEYEGGKIKSFIIYDFTIIEQYDGQLSFLWSDKRLSVYQYFENLIESFDENKERTEGKKKQNEVLEQIAQLIKSYK